MTTLLLVISLITMRDSATGAAVRSDVSEAVKAMAADVPVTVWVDPLEPPFELQPHVIAAQLRAESMFVHGHVTADGEPVADVAVATAGVSARTDHRGYFAMHIPADAETTDFTFEREGLKRHLIRNTLVTAGADVHFIVQMHRGDGTTERDDSHKIWLHTFRRPSPREAAKERPFAAIPLMALSGTFSPDGARRANVDIPETIRVGFDCPSANTCARVEIMSLDTYVKRGLNDEWIASWSDNSLRAGAVAYRSYGGWHVAHPRTTSYDICSTTSCQVNDLDTSFRTDLAVDATRGWILLLNGEIFRSEYSAENNNLLGERSCSNVDRRCGDGFAGSPAAGWPCLADFVCTGFSCFGHGRGMCQWGTQRWSLLGADWRWIVNHYYNDSGTGSGFRSAELVGPEEEPLPRRRAVGR